MRMVHESPYELLPLVCVCLVIATNLHLATASIKVDYRIQGNRPKEIYLHVWLLFTLNNVAGSSFLAFRAK